MISLFEHHVSKLVVGGALAAILGLGVIVFTIRAVVHARIHLGPKVSRPARYLRIGLALMVVGGAVFGIAFTARTTMWERECTARCSAMALESSRVFENRCECLVEGRWVTVSVFDPSP